MDEISWEACSLAIPKNAELATLCDVIKNRIKINTPIDMLSDNFIIIPATDVVAMHIDTAYFTISMRALYPSLDI